MNSSKTYKKKLIYITSRFPYPLEKGDKLRTYFQIRDLSEAYDIYLISTSDKKINPNDLEKLKPFCKDIQIFELNKILILLNLFLNLFSTKPFQVAYFYQRGIAQKINTYINHLKPDHIYCQLIRTTEYVKNYHHCSKTLDYMDALSVGMKRRVRNGFHLDNFIFNLESTRLENYERKIFDYFEKHSIISEQDQKLIQHPDNKKIKIIPNGVDERFLENKYVPKSYDVIFSGNMSYAPNVNAVTFIYEEIKPLLKNHNISFLIAGASPTKLIQSYNQKDFTITGWVDDIRDSYLSSKIFIAPMFIGTGLQNKLLEAMACGIPCVTTTLANNALLATKNKEILIAENSKEFSNAIVELLTNEELYKKLAINGKNFIKQNYSWKTMNQRVIDLIEQ